MNDKLMKRTTSRQTLSRRSLKRLVGHFGEQYEVSLNYKKPDGYWVQSHIEHVVVRVKHGVNEKNNHAAAEAIAKQRYPKCKINSVTYC